MKRKKQDMDFEKKYQNQIMKSKKQGKKQEFEFEKNQLLELTIQDLGVHGEGIGKAEGITFFVKDAIIGDKILAKIMKMKKNYGYARIIEILEPSPDRITPKCEVYRQCGGCQLQPLLYEKQLSFKENLVKNNLMRIGGFLDPQQIMEPILSMNTPFYYRNKAQFPVGKDKQGNIVTGFYASASHNIIPSRNCALGVKENQEILDKICTFMDTYQIPPYQEKDQTGLVRHILIRKGFFTGEILVCLVINGKKLPHAQKLVEALQSITGMVGITLNFNEENTNVILGQELEILWGQGYLTDTIGTLKYQISPLSFFQVNPIQTKKLYDKVLEYANLTGKEVVWDLYCGIGSISLFLAQKAKQVYGVEVISQAVENARNNAKINGLDNVEFILGKAEEVLPQFYQQTDSWGQEKIQEEKKSSRNIDVAVQIEQQMKHPDVIVVDPPRKGCQLPCLDTIIKMQPDRVVYVSCDSATLARDLKYLCENGYALKKVQPVDMFPQTVGVETVVLLSQQKPDDVIEVEIELDELDLTTAESKATYAEIKDYVLKEHGLKVSNLYISQIKRKCGIEVGENYNLPKSEGARGPVDLCSARTGVGAETARQPQCPEEKEKAIKDALEHFWMV